MKCPIADSYARVTGDFARSTNASLRGMASRCRVGAHSGHVSPESAATDPAARWWVAGTDFDDSRVDLVLAPTWFFARKWAAQRFGVEIGHATAKPYERKDGGDDGNQKQPR